MQFIDIMWLYFTNWRPLTIACASYLAFPLLYVGYRLAHDNTRAKTNALSGMFLSSVFFWSFIAWSLVYCQVWIEAYEYGALYGTNQVLGYALGSALLTAVPLAVFVRERYPALLVRRLHAKPIEKSEVFNSFRALALNMGVESAELLRVDRNEPLSLAVGGRHRLVIVSSGILKALDGEEIETVFAHELSHIKSGDAFLKSLAAAFRMVLPFDPLLRLVEPAIHREREYAADAAAAEVTQKPAALASALLKIYDIATPSSSERDPGMPLASPGRGLFRRSPPITLRVERLLKMADRFREMGRHEILASANRW